MICSFVYREEAKCKKSLHLLFAICFSLYISLNINLCAEWKGIQQQQQQQQQQPTLTMELLY